MQQSFGRGSGFGVLELVERLAFLVGMGGIERGGRVPGAAADFVQAQVAGDREQPGGKLRGDLVAVGRFVHLDEDILREVLGFRRVAQHAVSDIHERLLVFIHQLGESAAIALLDAQHQGGIGIERGGHTVQKLNKHQSDHKV